MKVTALLLSALYLTSCTTTRKAEHSAQSLQTLVDFNSDEGITRLETSKAKVDFFTLANQFEAQSNSLFCGPTTATIVLNAIKGNKNPETLPKDRSRLKPADTKFLPAGFDPAVSRYTQDAVVEKSPKPRELVFGKPVKVNGKDANDFGYQLQQFNALLVAHGLNSQVRVADDRLKDETILAEISQNLKTRGDYVLVNYKRAEVGQQGGGHISPLGAYDSETDSFLVLDVNPAKANWVWMPAKTLIKGMRSFDTVENRGYILVSAAK